MKKDGKQNQCNEVLAKLISCTKRKKRPISLVELSQVLKTAIDCLGSLDEVAESISLSTSMLKRFQLVDLLIPELRQIVFSRRLDSIDAVAEIAGLESDLQRVIMNILTTHQLNSEDIRGIVRLLRHHPDLGIDQIVEKVLKSRTRRIFVYEFIARESSKDPQFIRSQFTKLLGEAAIFDVLVSGSMGKLKVTSDGKKVLHELAKKAKQTVPDFIETVLNSRI